MANDPRTFKSVALEVRHVPEPEETFDPAAHDVADPVTGFVDIGAVVDGVFVILARRKAAGLFADIERAKQDADAARQAQEREHVPSPVPTASTEPPFAPPSE